MQRNSDSNIHVTDIRGQNDCQMARRTHTSTTCISSLVSHTSTLPSMSLASTLREEGNAQFKLRNWAEANKLYMKALEVDPKDKACYANLCVLRLKLFVKFVPPLCHHARVCHSVLLAPESVMPRSRRVCCTCVACARWRCFPPLHNPGRKQLRVSTEDL